MKNPNLSRNHIAPLTLALALGSTMLSGCGTTYEPQCHWVNLRHTSSPTQAIRNDLDQRGLSEGIHADSVRQTGQQVERRLHGLHDPSPFLFPDDSFRYCLEANGDVHLSVLNRIKPDPVAP